MSSVTIGQALDGTDSRRGQAPTMHVGLIGSAIQKSRALAMHEAGCAAVELKPRLPLFDTQQPGLGTRSPHDIADAAGIRAYGIVNASPLGVAVLEAQGAFDLFTRARAEVMRKEATLRSVETASAV